MVNLFQVMQDLGGAVRTAVSAVTQPNFGANAKLIIGGYNTNEFTPSVCPFVWVRPDEMDISTNRRDITEFAVKVAVGICPVRDSPSAVALSSAVDSTAASAKSSRAVTVDVWSDVPASKTAIRDTINDQIDRQDAMLVNLDAAISGYASAVSAADCANAITYAGVAKDVANSLASTLTVIKGALDTDITLAALSADIRAKQTELSGYITALTRETAAYSAAVDAYDESPMITEVTDGGNTIVYGAVRVLDSIRNAIIDTAYSAKCGIPVKAIAMTVNPASAFPIDWTEATITFGTPERL